MALRPYQIYDDIWRGPKGYHAVDVDYIDWRSPICAVVFMREYEQPDREVLRVEVIQRVLK